MTKTTLRKRLILFRHAKSSWSEGLEDHERPLADRGKKAAPVMGHYLHKSRLEPDLVLISTARRAQETWARASRAMKGKIEVRNSRDIYMASAEKLLAIIRTTPPEISTLMLVGHNPGMEDLAKLLMKDEGGEPEARLREKFPTAAIALFSFEFWTWADAKAGCASLDRFVTPESIA